MPFDVLGVLVFFSLESISYGELQEESQCLFYEPGARNNGRNESSLDVRKSVSHSQLSKVRVFASVFEL